MRTYAAACLILLSVSFAACAQPSPSSPAAKPRLEEAMATRDGWLARQKVVQLTARVGLTSLSETASVPVGEYIVQLERTPEGRFVVVFTGMDQKQLGMLLVQGGSAAVVSGPSQAEHAGAPWQPGLILLGAPLEPQQFLRYALALPGEEVFAGEIAAMRAQGSTLVGQAHSQWDISYDKWGQSSPASPLRPTAFTMRSPLVQAQVEIVSLRATEEVPASYRGEVNLL